MNGSYYQLDGLDKEFVKYDSKNKPDKERITAVCLVSGTEDNLAVSVVWARKDSRQQDRLFRDMESWRDSNSLGRLRSRIAQFDWTRLRDGKIRIEVRGVDGGLRRNLAVIEGALKIETSASEPRMEVRKTQQEVVLSMYFSAPSKKKVGVSFSGVPKVDVGQVTEYRIIAQDALDSIRGLQSLKDEIDHATMVHAQVSESGTAASSASSDESRAANAGTSASDAGDARQQRHFFKRRYESFRKRIAWLRDMEGDSLKQRYAVELASCWTTAHAIFFEADLRVSLPVPMFLLVFAYIQPALIRAIGDQDTHQRSARRAMAWVMAIGLVASQVLAVWSVPVTSKDAVFLWIFLSVFQIRVVVALTRRQLNAMRESLISYLNPLIWLSRSEEVERYKQLIEPLRGESEEFGETRINPIEAEGQSQLFLLIRLYCGVIGTICIIVTYFAVGERFLVNGEDFIYAANGGFIAGLSLLIIVASTVAVNMFADIAKVIRERDELFEKDISKLAIALVNVESGLTQVWGHLVEYLPNVSRTINSRLKPLWEGESVNHKKGSDALQERLISRGTFDEVKMSLLSLSNSTLLSNWFFQENWFNTQSEDVNTDRLAKQLTSRFSYRPSRPGSTLANFGSIPPDEELFLLSLSHLEEFLPTEEDALRKELEQMMSSLCLKCTRHIEAVNKPDSFGSVIATLDNLDLDASYFLDDFKLFLEIVRSADTQTSDGPKSQVRHVFDKKLRNAEFARVLYFAAWLSQANSYVETSLHKALQSEPPRQGSNKVDYTANLFANSIPKVFGDKKDLPEDEITQLLTINDGTQDLNRFNWILRANLSSSQSAIHCLVRAALARKRRLKFVEFETAADRWQPHRVLSLPIVPKYADRVRHLRAFLEIPDRSQKSIRLHSVHDELSLPITRQEVEDAAKWAFNERYVNFGYSSAQRLVEATRRWTIFCEKFGVTGNMKKVDFLPLLSEAVNPATLPQPNGAGDISQTVGNTALDYLRQWYESHNLKWGEIDPAPRDNKLSSLQNRSHKYHCLLRRVDNRHPIGIEAFLNDRDRFLREILVRVDPGVAVLFDPPTAGMEVPSASDEHLETLIRVTTDFCNDENNNEILIDRGCGFFEDQKQLDKWRNEEGRMAAITMPGDDPNANVDI